MPLSGVAEAVAKQGSVYKSFLTSHVLPSLTAARPTVIGVTIASANQLIPTIELLLAVRAAFPETYVVLGGNVVTRLRTQSSFRVLESLTDQIVLFQGERTFARILETIDRVGVAGARAALARVDGDEAIPCRLWPVPSFKGLDLTRGIGPTVLPYVSTRGCYWGKCRFCAISAGWSSTGYGGSAPATQVATQLGQIVAETGVSRLKFVDEALPASKVRLLCTELGASGANLEWEAYARLEKVWEDPALLADARAAGLRKLYFGLEQVPSATRGLLGKGDSGDPLRILLACRQAEIMVHLFCMVGFPGTSREDAKATVTFLRENESLVDTADLVGFRLDRGTVVQGVRALPAGNADWLMSLPYEPAAEGVLSSQEVTELETECQELLWQATPRLLHPLYRVVGPWESVAQTAHGDIGTTTGVTCSANCSSTL